MVSFLDLSHIHLITRLSIVSNYVHKRPYITRSISRISLSCSAGAECHVGGFCLVAGRYSSNIHHIARIFLLALLQFLLSVYKDATFLPHWYAQPVLSVSWVTFAYNFAYFSRSIWLLSVLGLGWGDTAHKERRGGGGFQITLKLVLSSRGR